MKKSQIDRAIELLYEDALEEIRKLTEATRIESGGVEVYSGIHPEHGSIHIIVPPANNSFMLLPFAIRQF